jgi:hypothetical protein
MYMMKKIMGVCLLMLVAVSGVQAQSFDDMVKRFEKCPKAECFHIGPFLMRIAKVAMSKEDFEAMDPMAKAMFEQVKHLTLLDLSDCSDEDKATFRAALESWAPEGYEAVDMHSDEGKSTEEDSISKAFLRVTDKRSYELITVDLKDFQCSQMKGALTEELLQLMAAQEAKDSKE